MKKQSVDDWSTRPPEEVDERITNLYLSAVSNFDTELLGQVEPLFGMRLRSAVPIDKLLQAQAQGIVGVLSKLSGKLKNSEACHNTIETMIGELASMTDLHPATAGEKGLTAIHLAGLYATPYSEKTHAIARYFLTKINAGDKEMERLFLGTSPIGVSGVFELQMLACARVPIEDSDRLFDALTASRYSRDREPRGFSTIEALSIQPQIAIEKDWGSRAEFLDCTSLEGVVHAILFRTYCDDVTGVLYSDAALHQFRHLLDQGRSPQGPDNTFPCDRLWERLKGLSATAHAYEPAVVRYTDDCGPQIVELAKLCLDLVDTWPEAIPAASEGIDVEVIDRIERTLKAETPSIRDDREERDAAELICKRLREHALLCSKSIERDFPPDSGSASVPMI